MILFGDCGTEGPINFVEPGCSLAVRGLGFRGWAATFRIEALEFQGFFGAMGGWGLAGFGGWHARVPRRVCCRNCAWLRDEASYSPGLSVSHPKLH